MGHIMVTTRYSDQQGSKSRQILAGSNQPRTPETYRLEDDVFGTNYSFYCHSLECCQYFPNYKRWGTLFDVLPIYQKSHQTRYKSFPALRGLHGETLCDILQAMAPTNNVKTVHQNSLFYIESNLDRLGLLSPTHGQRSQQQSGQITLHTVLINKSKFLKATHHTKNKEN